MDPSPDKVPVRERSSVKMANTAKTGSGVGGGGDVEAFLRRTAAQEGAAITRLTREDLEDRYLRIYEDHLVLKRHAHKQEERMKKMATKLMRLVNDKKKGATGGASGVGSAPSHLKDVESQEKIAELEEQVIGSSNTFAIFLLPDLMYNKTNTLVVHGRNSFFRRCKIWNG